MTQSQSPITGTTHTLPFDKLSPRAFERLCLWLVEREEYERAEHLGAAELGIITGSQREEQPMPMPATPPDKELYQRPDRGHRPSD